MRAFTGTPSSLETQGMGYPRTSSLVAGALDPNIVDQARKGVFYALVPGSGLFVSPAIAP